VALPLEGALSPNNCRRSEAEKSFPCSKLQGIHKLSEAPIPPPNPVRWLSFARTGAL